MEKSPKNDTGAGKITVRVPLFRKAKPLSLASQLTCIAIAFNSYLRYMQGQRLDLNIEKLFKPTTIIKDEIHTYQERR
jgi:hypothetical protein